MALLMVVNLSGCNTDQSLANGGRFEMDITKLFAKHGVTNVKLECNRVDRSRTATCVFSASPELVARLVSGLNLQEVTSQSSAEDSFEVSAWEAEGGCRSTATFNNQTPTKVYKSKRRADELSVDSESTLEYLLLYHRLDTNELCVQASEAYG
jgi:hypothetical protein